MRRWVLLGLLSAIGLPAALAQTAQTREFRDWRATCSSIASACAGWTHGETGDDVVFVRRSAAWQAGWELGLQLPAGWLTHAQGLRLRVGTHDETLLRDRDWYEGAIAGQVMLVDADVANDVYRASTLLAAMVQTDTLRLDVADVESPGRSFSLRGLAATLRWIDERQDTKDSWPVVQTPSDRPDVAPTVRQAQRHYADDAVLADVTTLPAAVRRQREQAQDCLPLVEAADGRGYQVQWLDAHTALFSVACQLTTNEPLDVHVVAHAPDFQDGKLVLFPLWDESQPQPEILAAPVTSPVSRLALPALQPLFSRLQVVRQDNHGGLEQTWRWDGRAMHLIEVRRMTMSGDSERPWVVQWQAFAVDR